MAGKGGARPGAGRPKGRVSLDTIDIQTQARKYVPGILEHLDWLAKNSPSHSAQVAASNLLLERAYGKAVQPVEAKVEVTDAREMSRAELLAIAALAKVEPPAETAEKPADETLH